MAADTTEPRPVASCSPPSPVSPVAETMRRVHQELAAGAPPTFEALLAYGVPAGSTTG